jgi:outer membrane protein OmpA-like peptidoglycan-associated protein
LDDPFGGHYDAPVKPTHRFFVGVTLALVPLVPTLVRAQDFDPRNFEPALSPGAIVGLETSWVPAHLDLHVGLVGTLANDELVGAINGVRTRGPLHERIISTLGIGLGLFDRLDLEVAMPLHATSAVEGDDYTFSPGDLRIGLRGRLFGPAAGESGVGLGLAVLSWLPTGSTDDFSSDGVVSLEPRLVVDWRSADGFVVALQAGYRLRGDRRIIDLAIGQEIRYGLGLELPMAALGSSVPLSFLAEAEGAIGFGESPLDPEGVAEARKRPLEARFGARVYGEQWALTAAGGTGLTKGYGAPDFRVVVGFTWSTGGSPRPALPEVVAGAGDGVNGAGDGSDGTDGARASDPAPTFPPAPSFGGGAGGPSDAASAASAEAFAAALEAASAADPDADGDGVPVPQDQCPSVREDLDGFHDEDGCPDPDNDNDGVLDAKDKCPTELETPNGIDDDDGCPDVGEAKVVAKEGAIEIAQRVEFNSGSNVLAPSAGPLLEQIAAVLKANPQVRRVRIEGHTDNQGDEEMNVDLSERRAARVKHELVELGVDPGRLLPKGFGSTHPLAPNTTKAGRNKNRRVEFRIVDPPPPGAPRIDFDSRADEAMPAVAVQNGRGGAR